jgi:methionyl-tRNA formyltransferase
VADCEPDLIVSIRFGQILEEPVIAVPRIGVINLHSGLLPAYKGVMASFWSLLNGERQLGTTLHWITDSKIDSGAIISTQQQQVDTSKTYLQQVLSLYEPGARQITEAVKRH